MKFTKKTQLLAAAVLAAAVTVCTGIGALAAIPQRGVSRMTEQLIRQYEQAAPSLTEDEAKEIALKNAGLRGEDVTFVRSHPDWEDGRPTYEIEFFTNDMEYDYEIDAVTGNILSMDRDAEFYHRGFRGNAQSWSEMIPATPSQAGYGYGTGAARPKHGSLMVPPQAGLLAPAENREQPKGQKPEQAQQQNLEQGQRQNQEQGQQWKQSQGQPQAGAGIQGALITEDQAYNIALQHAGAAPDQVWRKKVRLDYEHGRRVYEIDFKAGYFEYEYEVDAETGSILKAESDYDD